MTDQPDWTWQTPNTPGIHNRRQPTTVAGPSQEEMNAARQAFVRGLWSAIGNDLNQMLNNALGWLFGTTKPTWGTTPVVPAVLPNINAGTGPGQSADLLTHLNNVAAQTGSNGATPTAAALAALQTQANTLASLSAQVQSQQTQTNGASQSGQSFMVDFSDYPNGPFSVTPFTTHKTGAGTGGLVISNGAAEWATVNNGDVSILGVFNNGGVGQAFTNTDYQQLRAALSAYPNGAGSRNYAIVRANSAGTTYVYGVIFLSVTWQLSWEVGCFDAAGSQHVWATGTNAPLNLNFILRAGVGGNPYRFQGISGNTVVFDYTDSAHNSALGAAYRYWGFRSDTASSGQVAPAPAAFVGCADNAAPTIPGSGFRSYCSSSTVVGAATTMLVVRPFPSGFFDTIVGGSSSDYTVTTGTVTVAGGTYANPGAVQVANAGRYLVHLRADMQANASTGMFTVSPAIARLNSAGTQQEILILDGLGAAFNIVGAQDYTSHFGGMGVLSCLAGDILVPCTYIDGIGTVGSFSVLGEASGAHSYFGVTLANWSLN